MRPVFMVSLLAVFCMLSCTSPLDVDTNRINTRLNDYLVTKSITVKVISIPGDTFAIANWNHNVEKATLQIDTLEKKRLVWMEYVMVAGATFPGGLNSALKRLHFRMDSMMLMNHTNITGDPTRGTGVQVTTKYHTMDTVYSAGCILNYDSETGRLNGTLLVTSPWDGQAAAQIVIDIAAERP